ncbi:MAG: hypothetical protein M1812_002265 [Candelaria pacifica]|nr:MAG: hypothetical protein M1812_002265 [Candelaria pacifica]
MDCMRDGFTGGILLDGRFEAISPLNHGSFGMVFMAKDHSTGDHVAIKCLTKPSAPPCPTALAVDERSEELACHARLGSHPNIVNLLHSFETEAHIYLVLEFCSMGDLYEAIRLGRGPLETENVRDFMAQFLDAVEFMHSKGLYHRDIKPENIFLTQSGNLKLGDFGLATTQEWTDEVSVGSDRYMSPEQYDPAGTGYSSAKADIWAVGICLLNILFFRNPFKVPNVSDPLFADFSLDRQSLFDVFPNMSQDTYEVLVHSLAIDPGRRSLTAMREALNRVISFTTDDEQLDEFCTEDREVVAASANREPLRTPSISSPSVDQGSSFPWAKALQMSPQQPTRQLSAIPDTEDYSEDLFPDSEKATNDTYSIAAGTPSMASVLDSTLGTSLKSLAMPKLDLYRSEPKPIPGSMPFTASNALPSMSSVFGHRDGMASKSWSDLWDEDEEEEMAFEHDQNERREKNSRSWSQESKEVDDTIRREGLLGLEDSTIVNVRTSSSNGRRAPNNQDGGNENDVFFFEEHKSRQSPTRYSPPSKRSIADKWAALGERRRAFQANTFHNSDSEKQATVSNGRRGLARKFSGYVGGVWGRKDTTKDTVKDTIKDTVKDWRHENRQRRDEDVDTEWVEGWHNLHAHTHL